MESLLSISPFNDNITINNTRIVIIIQTKYFNFNDCKCSCVELFCPDMVILLILCDDIVDFVLFKCLI